MTDGSIVRNATSLHISIRSTTNITIPLTVSDPCSGVVAEDVVFVPVGKITGLRKICVREAVRKGRVVNGLHVHVVEDL